MKLILAMVLLVGAAPATAAESFQAALTAHAPTHPALYSFADVYRLTISGAVPSLAEADMGEAPIRVAITQPAPASELQFFVDGATRQERWPLVLAGVAAALWVARRRLGYL